MEHYPAMVARMPRRTRNPPPVEPAGADPRPAGTSESALKDAGLGLLGNLAALAHAPMQDEVLKNSFANYAFEHYEIASYRALIEMARRGGRPGRMGRCCSESLQEEI